MNNDPWPKFGIILNGKTESLKFFVDMTADMTATKVGVVHQPTNGDDDWDHAVSADVENMKFTNEDKIKLAVTRDGKAYYFYVNDVLVLTEENAFTDEKSAVGIFSFNTVMTASNYKFYKDAVPGENFFGTANELTTTPGVDLSKDTGATTGTVTVNIDGSTFMYARDFYQENYYFETKIHVNEIYNDEAWPKFGILVQDGAVQELFFVDMKTDKTSGTVGVVHDYNWGGSKSVKVSDMSFSGEGEYVTLGVLKDEKYLHFFVDGKHAISYQSDLGNKTAVGVFGFNTGMELKEYYIDQTTETKNVKLKLLQRYGVTTTGNGSNIDLIKYDVDTDTISIGMQESNSRTFAALYENGLPVQGTSFAVTGRVCIENTKTEGSAASKVEFQVGKTTQDFVKMYVYRYQTDSTENNSIFVEGADSKKGGSFNGYAKQGDDGTYTLVTSKQNNLPKGDPYEVDYMVIYEKGIIYLILDEELVYRYEGSYSDMTYCFGVRQYADVTWTETEVIYDEHEIAVLAKPYRLLRGEEVTLTTEHVSLNESSEIYSLETVVYKSDMVLKNEEVLNASYYRVGGVIVNTSENSWAQSEITIKSDDTHAVRFVLEKTDKGYYQVFAEKKFEDDNWQERVCIINPNNKSSNIMNFDVVVVKDTIYLLLNDEIYYSGTWSGIFDSSFVTIGGQNVSMSISSLNASVFENEAAALEYIDSKEEYTYVSSFKARINSEYDDYFGDDSATVTGGTLLLGSSTIDFWGNTNYCGAYDWESTTGLTDGVNGYNVGIGGTIVEDWLYAYDKLIKPFEASKFVIFIGGNNITIGDSASYTAGKVAELLEKIHTDFPNSEIYYIYSLPVPARYANGAYTSTEYGGLINQMKTYCNSQEWVTGVDAFDALTTEDGQNPKEGIWKPDGIHQNEEGYRIWGEYLKNIIFKYAVTANGIEGLSMEPQVAGATVDIDLSDSKYSELTSNEDFSIAVKLVRDGSEVEVVKNENVYSFTMPAEPVNVCSRFAISGKDYTILTKSSLGNGSLDGIVQDSENGTVTITSNNSSTRYFGTVKMGDAEVCGTDYTFTAHLKAENCALSGSFASKIDLQVWSKKADGTLGRYRRPNIYRFASNNRIYEVANNQEICKTNACTYDGTSEFEADIKFIVKGDTAQLLLKIQGEKEYTRVYEYTGDTFENGVYIALGAQYIKVTFSDMVWTQGGAVLK